MIKAYFFDWMETLGVLDGNSVRKMLTDEQHATLLTKKLKDVDLENKEKIYSILNKENLVLYPDSEKIIRKLNQTYWLAIVSNMYDVSAERIRNLFPSFLKNFDIITWSAEISFKKPDPKIFSYTLNKLNMTYDLNIRPEEIVMIGDSQKKDIEPAIKMGIQARLIDRKIQNLEDVI